MNEKTTIYIDSDLKRDVQIALLQSGKQNYLSKLINELLQQWLEKQPKD